MKRKIYLYINNFNEACFLANCTLNAYHSPIFCSEEGFYSGNDGIYVECRECYYVIKYANKENEV